MEDVNCRQQPNNTPEGINAQQATQLYQASQPEEPAGTSDNQSTESGSDPEVPTAWMSDLVQELVNTQESEKPRVQTYLSALQLSLQDTRAGQGRLEHGLAITHQRD